MMFGTIHLPVNGMDFGSIFRPQTLGGNAFSLTKHNKKTEGFFLGRNINV